MASRSDLLKKLVRLERNIAKCYDTDRKSKLIAKYDRLNNEYKRNRKPKVQKVKITKVKSKAVKDKNLKIGRSMVRNGVKQFTHSTETLPNTTEQEKVKSETEKNPHQADQRGEVSRSNRNYSRDVLETPASAEILPKPPEQEEIEAEDDEDKMDDWF